MCRELIHFSVCGHTSNRGVTCRRINSTFGQKVSSFFSGKKKTTNKDFPPCYDLIGQGHRAQACELCGGAPRPKSPHAAANGPRSGRGGDNADRRRQASESPRSPRITDNIPAKITERAPHFRSDYLWHMNIPQSIRDDVPYPNQTYSPPRYSSEQSINRQDARPRRAAYGNIATSEHPQVRYAQALQAQAHRDQARRDQARQAQIQQAQAQQEQALRDQARQAQIQQAQAQQEQALRDQARRDQARQAQIQQAQIRAMHASQYQAYRPFIPTHVPAHLPRGPPGSFYVAFPTPIVQSKPAANNYNVPGQTSAQIERRPAAANSGHRQKTSAQAQPQPGREKDDQKSQPYRPSAQTTHKPLPPIPGGTRQNSSEAHRKPVPDSSDGQAQAQAQAQIRRKPVPTSSDGQAQTQAQAQIRRKPIPPMTTESRPPQAAVSLGDTRPSDPYETPPSTQPSSQGQPSTHSDSGQIRRQGAVRDRAVRRHRANETPAPVRGPVREPDQEPPREPARSRTNDTPAPARIGAPSSADIQDTFARRQQFQEAMRLVNETRDGNAHNPSSSSGHRRRRYLDLYDGATAASDEQDRSRRMQTPHPSRGLVRTHDGNDNNVSTNNSSRSSSRYRMPRVSTAPQPRFTHRISTALSLHSVEAEIASEDSSENDSSFFRRLGHVFSPRRSEEANASDDESFICADARRVERGDGR